MIILLQWLLIVGLATSVWAQEKGWEKEWNRILAAAKREGKVVVAGVADPVVRRKVPAAFKARYGIPVEFLGHRSSSVAGKLGIERRVGVYTIDAFLSGLGTASRILYPPKWIDPIKPVLILPEVVDPSKWKKGKLWFADPEEKYILRLLNYTSAVLFINTDYVKPEEFKSIKDLLNPKWRGKISVIDPTARVSTAAYLYAVLGEEFVKKLYIDQKPAISRSVRQIDDWLGRGTYPISLDAGQARVKRMQDDGFPVMSIDHLPGLKSTVTAGQGMVSLLNKPPHPNAVRVFLNWLTSKEGLEVYGRAWSHPVTRNDIDELSFVVPEEIPRPGGNYFDTGSWEFTVTVKEKVILRMKELLKRY